MFCNLLKIPISKNDRKYQPMLFYASLCQKEHISRKSSIQNSIRKLIGKLRREDPPGDTTYKFFFSRENFLILIKNCKY
jgi:hypothetical protein